MGGGSLWYVQDSHYAAGVLTLLVNTVAAAVELQSHELFGTFESQSADGQFRDIETQRMISCSLKVLIQCCLAPVSSWRRSDEDRKALFACVCRVFAPSKISAFAGMVQDLDATSDLLRAVRETLEYLCESPHGRDPAAGGILEAATQLCKRVDSRDLANKVLWYAPWVNLDAEKLRRMVVRCKELGIGGRGAMTPH